MTYRAWASKRRRFTASKYYCTPQHRSEFRRFSALRSELRRRFCNSSPIPKVRFLNFHFSFLISFGIIDFKMFITMFARKFVI